MAIRIAVPKGRLLKETAQLADTAGWQLSDYSEGARLYYLTSGRYPDLSAKILHEKDIPVQVAMGNYDLGVCGLDWIQELVSKYPASRLVKIKDLGFGGVRLLLAAARGSPWADAAGLRASDEIISIASEYPNYAEALALKLRLRRFNVFPLWGAAEIYPPDNADLVLLADGGPDGLPANLVPVLEVLNSTAFLIANKDSLESKDLSRVLETVALLRNPATPDQREIRPETAAGATSMRLLPLDAAIRLALPDGHAQKHVTNILAAAGIKIVDYPSPAGNRTPEIGLAGFRVKVVRPQDMPLQVANGKFDIAITGRDWVTEHLYQFPASPVAELADLKYSKVKIVVAVHNDLAVDSTAELRTLAASGERRIRVASEYTRIADKYARDNHLGMYRVIPTWGATEAFLPDDADVLIENTETGSTLKRHNLKIIDVLFESTACLIANKTALRSKKAAQMKAFAETLLKAVA